ncbi:MAG TPA: lysine-sensitive aspartokinase 3 [Vicinamibacterales bacterium]|nr:lysine-sensitive aspartokinase 3 [Vicinamibacterales bacterium]
MPRGPDKVRATIIKAFEMVVQKFGGTSVADPAAIRRLIEIVRTARGRDGRGPAVVVSAMSGVTDLLLGIASAAGSGGGTADALARIEQLRERHLAAVRELAAANDHDALTTEINATLDQLAAVAQALTVLREVSPRTLDVIAAMGELLSSRIVAAALNAAGVASEWVDARRAIVTSADHMRATPLTVETARALRATVVAALDAKRVPVLGGFVGATVDGHTTTLGRGGSDYSGALVGAGVGAREIQIWTDVDGMLTADPRVIKRPRLVPKLSFAEAAELAYFGAKVLHPSTILPAVERNIPVRILNSMRPDGSGTLITAEPSLDGTPLTGLASKGNVIVVDITSTRMLMAYGFLRRVFEVFERFSTAVDVVTTSEVSVSVTVDDPKAIPAITEALSEFAEVSIERDMALLCAVGDRLRDEPKIAAQVVSVLEEVPLKMISQAASRRNITVVLRQNDLAHAMERLHEEFFQ